MLELQTRLQHPISVPEHDLPSDTIVTLPAYAVASLLFQSYEANVSHLCHILHIPTARSLLKIFYLQLSRSESVAPSQAALLLSIFAIAAYFYQPFDDSIVATTKHDAMELAKVLSRSALDVLDYSRRNTSCTLEDIQANILMSYVAFHLDGFSARGRLLSTAAASIARELRLHQLDADHESNASDNETNIRVLIDREVKRRVFWHIASTDWCVGSPLSKPDPIAYMFARMLSTISGPQEGTYLIHPNHVNVRLPRDCTDDDIVPGEEIELVTGTHPTGMSFFLERLRLAHLSREMTDTVPLETCRLLQLPYEQIMSLDSKLLDYVSSLPFFFRLDAESLSRSKTLETIYPKVHISRYCITIEAHSRRCKLHQRFLLRQAVDPRYAYSRRACLESARAVVRGYEDLRDHDDPSTLPELMGMAVHFTHLALVVMVMDLCFNRDEADESEVKAEVKGALQLFEEPKNASPLLGRFLSSLSDVLQKHKVQLTDPETVVTNNATGLAPNVISDDSYNSSNDVQMHSTRLGLQMQDAGADLDTSFDELWQSALQGEPDPDSLTWDNLFSTLDSRPL